MRNNEQSPIDLSSPGRSSREAMGMGEVMNDDTFIARMNYTIGRVYSLKQDYDTSIYFHEKHLSLARQLHDSVGQCRAYYILSQLYEKLNQEEKAKKYESLYRALSREVSERDFFPILSTHRSNRSMNRWKIRYPCPRDRDPPIICSKYVVADCFPPCAHRCSLV